MVKTIAMHVPVADRAFLDLAHFDMDPQDCFGEIIDNSIAAKITRKKCHINIYLIGNSGSKTVDVFIADDGIGMSFADLRQALILGGESNFKHGLHEYGFGLKNALATLTQKDPKAWSIWTTTDHNKYFRVDGPLRQTTECQIDAELPKFIMQAVQDKDIPPVSTMIFFRTTKSFLRGLTHKGGQALNVNKFGQYLLEHLGVKYREYLKPVGNKIFYEMNIYTLDYNERKRKQQKLLPVYAIPVPFENGYQKYSDEDFGKIILKNGQKIGWEIQLGIRNKQLVNKLIKIGVPNQNGEIKTEPAKYYYQGDIPRQGIDLEIHGRTIATSMINPPWKIAKHNSLNDFVGILKLKDVPQDCLALKTNKTNFDKNDDDWETVFEKISGNKKLAPIKNKTKKSESVLRDLVVNETNDVNSLTDNSIKAEAEYAIGNTGIKADVVISHKDDDKNVEIIECKVGKLRALDLAQLRLYCDEIVLHENKQPTKAIILCDEVDQKIKNLADEINDLPRPKFRATNKEAEPYNFVIADAKNWWERAKTEAP